LVPKRIRSAGTAEFEVLVLVYGDIERWEQPARMRRRIAEQLTAAGRLPGGRHRHEALVTAFIETGALLQGLADQAFHVRQADDVSPIQQSGAALLAELALAVMRSWDSGLTGTLCLPPDWPERLQRLDSPEPVRLKRPEGYAFYALYPEAYVEAAKRSSLSSDTVVIGLRSIGLGLASLVAAALGAGPAFSLRPVGHPFARRVEVAEALTRLILADPHCDFAIVDEGPGLSGSSFGGVADWLQSRGVSSARIHFFPSHAGALGPQASEAHRQRWSARPRHVVSMDDLLIGTGRAEHRLGGWVQHELGTGRQPWRDISGGAWRDIHYPSGDRPPSDGQMEKRKFLLGEGEQRRLVKFAGLAGLSQEKERKGRVLGEAGFTARTLGTCHGFLVEEWIEGTPGDLAGLAGPRMVEPVGRYLGFRARHLPAQNDGASLDALCRMAVFNVGEAMGPETAERLSSRIGDPGVIGRRLRAVDTDNRLHIWEWLVAPNGRILKTDALDHSGAHDLVGCQPVAWDVAGACVEFNFTLREREKLAAIIEREADCCLRADLLTVFEACYLGFQIGLWTNARSVAAAGERERIDALLERYAHRLRDLIADEA
jgi:hypothetical protein